MSTKLDIYNPTTFYLELERSGLITQDQAEIAWTEREKRGGSFGDILVSLGMLSIDDLTAIMAAASATEAIKLSDMVPDDVAIKLIPKTLAQSYDVFPVGFDADSRKLTVAISDTNDVVAMDQCRSVVPVDISLAWRLASKADIKAAIDRFYGYALSIDDILKGLRTGRMDDDALSMRGIEAFAHPIVRLIDALLADAVHEGASDLHFEPEEGFLRIRYRIDGVLRQVRVLHKQYWPALSVRLKVLSGMDIAETRAPQDGRISMVIRGHDVDFRAAAQPTIHGENFVLRVLDRRKSIVPMDKMGLPEARMNTLRMMLARPYGIILVTGPTGSGKTTTLYSILNEMNTESVNIMTLEDPVEYPMARIRQASAADNPKMDFANGIRSMMRQDPDIILVGEIRDHETAEMAFRAAMTGHQVFSTLHANSAVLAIARLLDLGIPASVMTGNLIGIVAQRLVRLLCPECKESYEAGDVEKTLLDAPVKLPLTLYRAVGCPQCKGQGYKGRTSIMELLRFDMGLDDLLSRNARTPEISAYARSNGFTTMAEDGLARVKAGSTSLEEVARVVDLTRVGT
ncbi:GspE/PulE family protein [Polaromonas sp.]|uniref:GspE/PulE family protein n=1 Tax=Polaromonas sp. TaxID=1869339 RepID=UPI0032647B66